MEVEFLSNMRYSLFVGEMEWRAWHKTLGKFSAYWEKASRAPVEVSRVPAPITPTLPLIPGSLPSPPPSTCSSGCSSLYVSSVPSPMALLHHQLSVPSQLMPAHSPITPMPQPDFQPSKKRSFDATVGMQPPTKRVTRSMAPKISIAVPQFAQIPPVNVQPPRLAVGHYPTSQPQQALAPSSVAPLTQLPFPGRAMATVYSQPTPQISPVSMGPVNHNVGASSPYSAHSRAASPYSQQQNIHHSAASSPTTPGFGPQQSPMWVRNSPYRPVRGVNTLLVPPAAMSPEALNMSWQRMHYQPLAKQRTEYKTGVVPYLRTDWPPIWSSPTPDYHV